MKRIIFNSLIMGLVMVNTVSCNTKIANNSIPNQFLQDWEVFSSDGIQSTGKDISSPVFQTKHAYRVDIPATVMATLVRHEVYENVFYSDNLKRIPEEPFTVPWWYRKSFQLETLSDSDFYSLVFEGLNYKANIWLNGNLIADTTTVEGCFRMWDFEVTSHLKKGKNVLAVEIIPPRSGDLTIGFVDWNPWPPDNNMGLWRPVKLVKTREVRVKNAFVKPSLDTKKLDTATLEVSADLVNQSDKPTKGKVKIQLNGSTLEQDYELAPKETKKLVFSPEQYTALTLANPKIWWPNNMGEPNLYTMHLEVGNGNQLSDSASVRFGIRKVEDYFNANGHRGYKINGKKMLIKGAGWVDDIFLDDSDEKVLDQIRYVKHMNLNTIRLEGFWGKNKAIYDYADEHGILIMIGWSCQWEWEAYCGRPEDEYLAIREPEEIANHARAYQDQVEWLRNHPSVFLWVYGSDKLLVPELEKQLNQMISIEDGTRPVLNSCGSAVSEVTGKSGVKMNGPYGYVTPNYWYVDDIKGGAFGFNTETGPGVQPSPLESVKRMIPQDHLWPIDNIWEYHLGRREFTTFEHWMKPFNARYGEEDNVEEFSMKAQMANYEAMRPMFEAFKVNYPNTTGVIQWMLNSAFPNMLWQLYDWYLMPNGAFYAAKNACRPLNIIYNYKDHGVYISNEFHTSLDGLAAEITVLNTAGKKVYDEVVPVEIQKNESMKIQVLPDFKTVGDMYFLDLRLIDSKDNEQITNFYWLSTKDDVLDYENSDWFLTGNSSYADLTGINRLKNVEVKATPQFTEDEEKVMVSVALENPTDALAFFIELSLTNPETGLSVLPVFWENNYISLLPGEKRTVQGYVYKKDFEGEQPVFTYSGWNMRK